MPDALRARVPAAKRKDAVVAANEAARLLGESKEAVTHRDQASVLDTVVVAAAGLCVHGGDSLFLHHRWLARFLQRLQGHHADVWERLGHPGDPGQGGGISHVWRRNDWVRILGGGYRKLEDAELARWGDRLRWLLIGGNVVVISALVYALWR